MSAGVPSETTGGPGEAVPLRTFPPSSCQEGALRRAQIAGRVVAEDLEVVPGLAGEPGDVNAVLRVERALQGRRTPVVDAQAVLHLLVSGLVRGPGDRDGAGAWPRADVRDDRPGGVEGKGRGVGQRLIGDY